MKSFKKLLDKSVIKTNDGKYVFNGSVIWVMKNIRVWFSLYQSYVIKKGDRLGQIRFSRPIKVELIEVDSLTETNRGDTGFGNSGK